MILAELGCCSHGYEIILLKQKFQTAINSKNLILLFFFCEVYKCCQKKFIHFHDYDLFLIYSSLTKILIFFYTEIIGFYSFKKYFYLSKYLNLIT